MFADKRVIAVLFLFSLLGIFFVFSYARSQSDSVNSIVKISVCGNFIVEGGEECDNYDFGSQSCSTFGFSSGNLICYPDCSINTTACYNQPPPPSGGSSGGGGLPPPVTGVNISGRAYPLSEVTVLKDGQIAAVTIAGPDANFVVSVGGLAPGNYTFAVYGQDSENRRSSLFTFPVYVSSGVVVNISGVFIAPTIALDKVQVKRGDDIAIFGQSIPQSVVTLSINSPLEIFRHINTDAAGIYLHNFDTAILEEGDHSAKAKSRLGDEVSTYGSSVAFQVGSSNIIFDPDRNLVLAGDSNGDGRVNLVDFSIMAYWYRRSNPPIDVDLNKDGKVDLVDFSIMAYYWTG